MVIIQHSKKFLLWYAELRKLAITNELLWLVSGSPDAHFSAFKKGLNPEEELAGLGELAQWRGCGCGGGA